MADKETKKQLIDAYKERSKTQTGGIYMIRNIQNGKLFIDFSADMTAAMNRFNFAKQMGSCPYGGNIKLNKDWTQYGSDAFVFEVSETIEKNGDQTPADFREDLQLLKKMWVEKYYQGMLY